MIKKWHDYKTGADGINRWIINFHKLLAEGFPINIIMTNRGDYGKTVSSFEYILDNYIKNEKRAIYLLNTESQFKKWKEFVIVNVKLDPERWKNVEVRKDGLYDKTKKNFRFCEFVALSNSHLQKSGSRDINLIVYEEFNEGTRYIGESQLALLDKLIYSSNLNYLDIKILIFGNMLSEASPLLAQYKVKDLHKEMQVIDNHPLRILVYSPKKSRTEKRLIAKSENWMYKHSELAGAYDQTVLGDRTFDDMVGVVPAHKHSLFKVYTQNDYLRLSTIGFLKVWSDKNGNYFLEGKKTAIESTRVIYWKVKYAESAYVFSKYSREFFASLLQDGKLYFDNFNTKSVLLESFTATT